MAARTVTIAAGQTVCVRINASNTILVDGGGLSDDNCGGNNAGTVTVINVDGSTGNETFRIDDSGGGGAFDDDDDFDIDLSRARTSSRSPATASPTRSRSRRLRRTDQISRRPASRPSRCSQATVRTS